MTERDAIGYLLNKYLLVGSPINPPKKECKKHNAVLDLAIQALEKQIPNKIWGNEHNPIVIGDTVRGLCPICYTEFICITPRYYKENGFGYCRQCGQKLDWND